MGSASSGNSGAKESNALFRILAYDSLGPSSARTQRFTLLAYTEGTISCKRIFWQSDVDPLPAG